MAEYAAWKLENQVKLLDLSELADNVKESLRKYPEGSLAHNDAIYEALIRVRRNVQEHHAHERRLHQALKVHLGDTR